LTQARQSTLGAQTALWRQARPGNTNALKTGLYSVKVGPKLRSRRVRRLVNRLFDVLPWLTESDRPAARSWAELEFVGAAVFAEIMANGVTNGKGEARRLVSDWRQLKQVQLAYERELGMTPAARANLGVDVARGEYYRDLAAEMQAAHSNGPAS